MNSEDLSPNTDPEFYLGKCEVIDWQHTAILRCAKTFRFSEEEQTARACFEFVRDEIRHSYDHRLNPVTCKASDVLKHRTGYCYAKSHLLCALLRANGISAGLCYQRLSIDGEGPPFCLHGLNAIFLKEFGWYRVDARGNKLGVNSRFSPPVESLAFKTNLIGERDFDRIWASPHPLVVRCLTEFRDWKEVSRNLPDVSDEASMSD